MAPGRSSRLKRLLAPAGLVSTALLGGCPNAELPESLPLELPGGKTVTAPRDSGTADLKDSTWMVWIVEFENTHTGRHSWAEPGEWPLGRVELDDKGGIRALETMDLWLNDVAVSSIIGERVLLDGAGHPAGLPGSTITADNYTARDESGVNLGGFGVISVAGVEGGNLQFSLIGAMNEPLTTCEGEVLVDFSVKGAFAGGEDLAERVRYTVVAYRE
ncbi:hypothetical protein RAS1_24530 [Phycisphaerae bacterium RAS1]|nr:hypothetical protein RAS1_24530 [Phycisphaerae bacterium RAS1]